MTQEILSSAGRPGSEQRSDGRWYCNAEFEDCGQTVLDNFETTVEEGHSHTEELTRVVYRGIVSDQALNEVRDSQHAQDLEVALPLHEFGINGALIYLGRNSAERSSAIRPDLTAGNYTAQIEPSTIITTAREQQLRLVADVDRVDIDQLAALWTPGFGWTSSQLTNFAESMHKETDRLPADRNLWFAAVCAGDTLLSACMAEPIELQGPNGQSLTLIESTEWMTRPSSNSNHNWRRRGFMKTALVALNAQILDHARQANINPVIYAETNISSRADYAGHAAGFRIPDQTLAPQVIRQNVCVEAVLRDFFMMYLPADQIIQHYDAVDSGQILDQLEGYQQ